MLLILLIRGLTLPGAWDGIYYYLYPDITHLANLKVWIEAGSQVLFSYCLTTGTLNVLSSYNRYNNNCYKDCFWLCLLNSGTSFIAGFVVFSVLGFMAQKQGVTVDVVVDSGPGLAFIAYPQATALMPLPQFWSVCFFLMLVLLTVDTHVGVSFCCNNKLTIIWYYWDTWSSLLINVCPQFVFVESFITTVTDMFPKLFRVPVKRQILVLLVCLSNFCLHLSLVTQVSSWILTESIKN
nr:sodium- and chloride-dependent GABA transporter 3-like [Nothobranchius furzeri]